MFVPEGSPATHASGAGPAAAPAHTHSAPPRAQRSHALWTRVARPTHWQVVAWLFSALSSFALIRMSLDSGITLDEGVHVRYGEEILAWFKSGFQDSRALTCPQRKYGGMFDFLGAALNELRILPLDTIRVVHLLSALFGLWSIWATWKMAAQIGGPLPGFLGAAFLALTPSFVGHSLFNPKDIPFAAGAALTFYASVCIVMERSFSWKSALRAGFSVGVALAMRPGGLFLLVYPLAAALGNAAIGLWERRHQPLSARALLLEVWSLGLKLALGLTLAWTIMVAAWPWALQRVLWNPVKAMRTAANYPWRSVTLFDGERIHSFELPWTYLPTWFGITAPELYLIALGCAGVCGYLLLRKRSLDVRKALAVALLTGGVVLPFLGVLIKRSIIYDAHRHFLFLYPALAALAGLATARVLEEVSLPRLLRGTVVAALAALAGLCMFDMHKLHPYEYVYFNRLFGGLPAAHGRFETDYWGAANREAFLWVFENVKSEHKVRVGACYASWQFKLIEPHAPGAERFEVSPKDDDAQIYIATTRDDCHAHQQGRVLHTVAREGVPLAYVFQR